MLKPCRPICCPEESWPASPPPEGGAGHADRRRHRDPADLRGPPRPCRISRSFLPLVRAGERAALDAIYAATSRSPPKSACPCRLARRPGGRIPNAWTAWVLPRRATSRASTVMPSPCCRTSARRGPRELRLRRGRLGPRRDGYDPTARRMPTRPPPIIGPRSRHSPSRRRPALRPDLRECGRASRHRPRLASTGLPYALAPVIDGRRPPARRHAAGRGHRRARRGATAAAPPHGRLRASDALQQRAAARRGRAIAAPCRRASRPMPRPCRPSKLDRLDHLDEGVAEDFGAAMSRAACEPRLKVLGGCCGTSDAHIRALARRLTAERAGRYVLSRPERDRWILVFRAAGLDPLHDLRWERATPVAHLALS